MAKIEVRLIWDTTGLKMEERVIELDENDTISFEVFTGNKPASSFEFDFGERTPFEENPITNSTKSPKRVMRRDANFKFSCKVNGTPLEGAELPNPGRKTSMSPTD